MSRSTRLFDVLQALRRRRRPVAAATLAEELGVSLRTVYRDIGALVAQGAPIEGEAGLGYVLQPGFFLPPLMFGPEEVDALILGLRMVADLGDPALAQGADDALAKIVDVLPVEMEDVAATSGLLTAKRNTATPHLPLLRRAMREEETVRLAYADKTGQATERVVWPVALGFFQGTEVLAAWCELRRDFRHFRLDRIAAIDATGTRYPKRRRLLLAEWRLQEGLASETHLS